MFGYDDEDNIVRDVEEDEGKRVVINMAAEEDDDDTKYYWLLVCVVFSPHQSHIEVGPAAM